MQKLLTSLKTWNKMKIVKVSEVEGFDKWLKGQTCPIVDGDEEPFDWAYYEDYERFIKGLPVID